MRYNIGKRERARRIIENIKKNGKCIICGEEEPAKLTFHHRNPEEKLIDIADLPRRRPTLTYVMRELDKCDLVCTECHRRIHNESSIE